MTRDYLSAVPSASSQAHGASDRTADDAVRFAIGTCSLGSILVAASDRGLCALLLGDSPPRLVRDLRRGFPDARPAAERAALAAVLAAAVALVEDPARGFDAPLDPRGTPFQMRVWEALRDIPAGATASYGEIARRIGAPAAAIEVGLACAANTIAVAIPCHRVVKKDGGLAGYRWGVARKRALLEREVLAGASRCRQLHEVLAGASQCRQLHEAVAGASRCRQLHEALAAASQCRQLHEAVAAASGPRQIPLLPSEGAISAWRARASARPAW